VSKNVAVFVDVANIFYAAKAAGVDIDYVTLLKSAVAGRDFVRAYAYTGLDPDNENQRNFHAFLARHDYKVVSKDIRKYGDGKVKANLDIELVVDMMKTARNLDVAIVVSGDGDFAPAIRAVQEMGVRVEVISFRGNTSSDLIEVADVFTDIVQLARVEKGSSRSGRRVADDGEDLSMTEVPDKMTEGTGRGRGRGTGRGRGRTAETREPVAATTRPAARRGRSRTAEPAAEAAPGTPIGLVALPGEKLSKAAQARLDAAAAATDEEGAVEGGEALPEGSETDEAEGQRRRRRRGGRGRGRGRGRGEGELETGAAPTEGVSAEHIGSPSLETEEEELEAVAGPPRAPRPGAFGSVWDSQIGQTRVPSVETTPFDIEDEDEPAIPEYLIAEQRRASSGGGNRGRGGARAGYASAVDRERYGRGGSSGGVNRYPDVSGRGGRPSGGGGQGGRGGRGTEIRRDDRPTGPRPDRDRAASGRSDEPWSEVPPELEAILRAQLAAKGEGRPSEGSRGRPARSERSALTAEAVTAPEASASAETPAPAKRRPSTRARASEAPASGAQAPASGAQAPASAAPKRRAPARTAKASAEPAPETPASAEAPAAAAAKRRPSTRAKAAPASGATPSGDEAPAAPAPKRRAPARKKAVAPDA